MLHSAAAFHCTGSQHNAALVGGIDCIQNPSNFDMTMEFGCRILRALAKGECNPPFQADRF
jgi:hypothetical protein